MNILPLITFIPYCLVVVITVICIKIRDMFLLISLSLSDTIFGFTLLVIGIKSLQYSGDYCEVDFEWRSSFTCNVIGILTIFASQQSTNLLVMLAGLRAYITYYPFKSKQLSFNLLAFFTVISMGMSVILASFPVWGNSNLIVIVL